MPLNDLFHARAMAVRVDDNGDVAALAALLRRAARRVMQRRMIEAQQTEFIQQNLCGFSGLELRNDRFVHRAFFKIVHGFMICRVHAPYST